MSALSVVAELPGVRSAVIGDSDGLLVEHDGKGTHGENVAAVAAVLAQEFARASVLLGFGSCSLVSVKAPDANLVIGFRDGSTFCVELEPNRATAAVESKLRATDWAAQIERVFDISDVEIEYVTQDLQPPPRPSVVQVAAKQTVPRPSPTQAHKIPPPAVSVEEADDDDESWVLEAVRVSHAATTGALRRALVKGQLSKAESLVRRLHAEAVATHNSDDPFHDDPSDKCLRPLLDGIAGILAGDNFRGLKHIKAVGESAKTEISFRWAAQIWCARAILSAGDDLEIAQAYVNRALELTRELDVEARAVTLLTSADISFHSRNYDDALEALEEACVGLDPLINKDEIASALFLRAQVLSAQGHDSDAQRAAEQAHAQRPSWPAPIIFAAKRSLKMGRVDEAEKPLLALSSQGPVSNEVHNFLRLIEFVRSRAIPAQTAHDYLKLVEAAPSRETIGRLQTLVDAYPELNLIRETLGWMMLRAGEYARAGAVFNYLSARHDLSTEESSSVLLALGCLAAVEQRHAAPGTRLRAAVSAAPAHLKSSAPPPVPALRSSPPPSSLSMMDFRELEKPDSARDGLTPAPMSQSSARLSRGGPVFAGDLQLFALPDLLEFLRSGQRTGTLVCSSASGIGAIHLRNGFLTGAASPNTKTLGEYLKDMGSLSAEKQKSVDRVHDEVGDKKTQIGSILVSRGLVTEDDVRAGLRQQIRDAVSELMAWIEGQFAFDPEASQETSPTDIVVEVNPQSVLLDIFKDMDEAAQEAQGQPW